MNSGNSATSWMSKLWQSFPLPLSRPVVSISALMNVSLVLCAFVHKKNCCIVHPSLEDKANHIILPFFLSKGLALPPSLYWTKVDNWYPVVKLMQTFFFQGLGFSTYLTKEEEEFKEFKHFVIIWVEYQNWSKFTIFKTLMSVFEFWNFSVKVPVLGFLTIWNLSQSCRIDTTL